MSTIDKKKSETEFQNVFLKIFPKLEKDIIEFLGNKIFEDFTDGGLQDLTELENLIGDDLISYDLTSENEFSDKILQIFKCIGDTNSWKIRLKHKKSMLVKDAVVMALYYEDGLSKSQKRKLNLLKNLNIWGVSR